MCDRNETSTASNIAVSTSDSGIHIPTDTDNSSRNNNNNRNQATYYQNLTPQPAMSSSGAGIQVGLQQHLTTLQNHSMIMNAHQQHQVAIHHQLNPYGNQHLQHQLMEGHHHQQAHQINLHQQQNNGLQFSPQFPQTSSHIAHPKVHNNQQTLVPFGMNFNSNIVGNGPQYINNQVGTFPHQLTNQQPAHAHQMQQPQHTSCFMQDPRMYMQHQPLATLNAPKSTSTVSRMSSQTSSVPTSGSVGNTHTVMSPGMGAIPAIQHPSLPDFTTMPGGLEHVWKGVPLECQWIMTLQDIPNSARCRGYFTVGELLHLKRSLMIRLANSRIPVPMTINPAPLKNIRLTKKGKQESKRGPKKRNNQSNNNLAVSILKPPEEEGYGNGQGYENKQQQQRQPSRHPETNEEVNVDANMEQDLEDPESTFGEQMIAKANIKNEEIVINTNMPPITWICVAGALKDAMNALTSEVSNASADGDETGTGVQNDNGDEQKTQKQIENSESDHVMDNGENAERNGLSQIPQGQPETVTTGEELAMMHTLQPISGILPKKETQQAPTDNSTDLTKETLAAAPGDENNEMTEEEKERQKQVQLALTPILSSTMTTAPLFTETNTVNINISDNPGLCYTPLEIRPQGAPPPFRTSNPVLKFLQIGGYTIRSFSSANPNRIRVLFNNNRITYECQLPIIRTVNPNPGTQPMRRILTFDIGFEQISGIKFGTDTLFMRVEGAPFLSLSYVAALEEPQLQTLSPFDQTFLEHIESGQLKLSPFHQLYFLNERLVQQLQLQFREHPRLHHLFLEYPNSQEGFGQKRLKLS
ncbi:unnamed protein product [Orchesella dallaii]|uniref:Uncharacterized protein n=1 Tax=Orchesella dallaii TaxID=48710 RepID=A0ABP1RKS6_9HEXA